MSQSIIKTKRNKKRSSSNPPKSSPKLSSTKSGKQSAIVGKGIFNSSTSSTPKTKPCKESNTAATQGSSTEETSTAPNENSYQVTNENSNQATSNKENVQSNEDLEIVLRRLPLVSNGIISPYLSEKPCDESLFLLHVNINSLKKNFKKLENLIQAFTKKRPDAICVSEINKPDKDKVKLDDYDYYENPATSNKGGVAIYVRNKYKSAEICQYKIPDGGTNKNPGKPNCETIWVELTTAEGEIVVGCVYRHPDQKITDFDTFENKLKEKISKIKKDDKIIYVLGDFNIDMLANSELQIEMSKHCALIKSLGFKLLITGPTRHVAIHKPSLIDHIYTNDSNTKNITAGIVQTNDVSDHFPIYCVIPVDSDSPTLTDQKDHLPSQFKLTIPYPKALNIAKGSL